MTTPDPDPERTADETPDPARHAVPRPAPQPPDPVVHTTTPAPAAAPPDVSEPAERVAAPGATSAPPERAATPVVTSVPPERVGPAAPPPTGAPVPTPSSDDPAYAFPDPSPPTLPGVGSHLLGVLTGLVLGPVGVAVALLGQSRILVVQAPGWDGTVESAGIALVLIGGLVLLGTALLGRWTAAVPLTAGGVLAVAGLIATLAPALTHDQVLALVSSAEWRPTVEQTLVAATSGSLVLVGALLLAAGLVTASARRNGVHVGAFRERHRPPTI